MSTISAMGRTLKSEASLDSGSNLNLMVSSRPVVVVAP